MPKNPKNWMTPVLCGSTASIICINYRKPNGVTQHNGKHFNTVGSCMRLQCIQHCTTGIAHGDAHCTNRL